MKKSNFQELTVDTQVQPLEQAVRAAGSAVGGLSQQLKTLRVQVSAAFQTAQAADMEKELLVLRLAWGKLKAAIADAAEPIAAVLVPAVTRAVYAATRLVRQLSQVIRALFGGADGADALAAGLEQTRTAAKKAGAAARSLAGFDELERLDEGGTAAEVTVQLQGTQVQSVAPWVQEVADQIRATLEPLLRIDLTPLLGALKTLAEAAGRFAAVVGEHLSWLWQQKLVPMLAWVTEQLLPTVGGLLTAALEAVTAALGPVLEGVRSAKQLLEPVTAFIRETVLLVLDAWEDRFRLLAQVFAEKAPQIQGILENVGQIFAALWTRAEPVLTALRTGWAETFGDISTVTADVTGGILDGLYRVTDFLAGAFTGDWQRTWSGVSSQLRQVVNSIIGYFNTMLTGTAAGINGIISMVNKLSFTVPQWVPELGGKTLGFQLQSVAVPQIPYLARGAVLPANKPFLAVVGDQRSGTNVEAPLATIQEAVAQVMQEQTGAILAGFEASVGVQKQILEAVLGIRIGDDVIAGAYDRYSRKMAVVRGG